MAIRFYCGRGHTLQVKNAWAGKVMRCPLCRVKVTVPKDYGRTYRPRTPKLDGELPKLKKETKEPKKQRSPRGARFFELRSRCRVTRSFTLETQMFPDPVPTLLDTLKKETVKVFPPGEISMRQLPDGSADVLANAKIPVKIREWLPVAVQSVTWDEGAAPDVYGCYRHNINEALFAPDSTLDPPGPAAYWGRVSVNQRLAGSPGAVMCVVAHELVHAFRFLPFLVPAFLNWRRFREANGLSGDLLLNHLMALNNFLDDYGQAEIQELETFWPAKNVREWVKEFSAVEKGALDHVSGKKHAKGTSKKKKKK